MRAETVRCRLRGLNNAIAFSYSTHSGCRERNALFRTFFIFFPFHGSNPHEEGSPFVTIIFNNRSFLLGLSRTVVMTVLLFLFANSRNRNISIESDNDKRDRFRLRGHVIEFPPRKSMTCKHINSFINGIFIPFMFFYVS